MPDPEPDFMMKPYSAPTRTPGAQCAGFWSTRGFLEGLALSILRTGVSLQHEGLRLDLRGTFLAVK